MVKFTGEELAFIGNVLSKISFTPSAKKQLILAEGIIKKLKEKSAEVLIDRQDLENENNLITFTRH